jgi:hypothetical protein
MITTTDQHLLNLYEYKLKEIEGDLRRFGFVYVNFPVIPGCEWDTQMIMTDITNTYKSGGWFVYINYENYNPMYKIRIRSEARKTRNIFDSVE